MYNVVGLVYVKALFINLWSVMNFPANISIHMAHAQVITIIYMQLVKLVERIWKKAPALLV